MQITIRELANASGLLAVAFDRDGMIQGYSQERHAIVRRFEDREEIIAAVEDSVLDVVWDGERHILAVRTGDSVTILCISKGTCDRYRTAARGGAFIPVDHHARWAWLSSDGELYVQPYATQEPLLIGRELVRSGAKKYFALADTTLSVLDGSGSRTDVVVWEGIALKSQGKRFSGFLLANLNQSAATATIAATVIRVGEGYAVAWYNPTELGDITYKVQTMLPPVLWEPLSTILIGDTALVFFRNGIAVVTQRGVLAVSSNQAASRIVHVRSLVRQGDHIIISDGRNARLLVLQDNPWWWIEKSVPTLFRLGILTLAAAVVLFIVSRIGRYRRLVGALLEKGTRGALIVVDRKGRLRRLNSVARCWLGIDQGTPLGRPLAVYVHTDWAPLVEIVTEALHSSSGVVREIALMHDGVVKRYLVTIEPLYGMFARYEGALLSIWDVTSQYEQWQLLNWAQLAHDLQTTVATIRLDAEQLSGAILPQGSALQQRILRQASALLGRIRDLLALGRGEKPVLEECALEELFREVASDLEPVIPAQISLVIRPTSLVAKLDRRRIARALHNAITNAIRAIGSSNGIIELSAMFEAESIVLSVRDTGVGMDEETFRAMQQPFFTTHHGGHGLGSIIMQRMVREHGGWIEIHSRLGEGTTVLFHLPRSLYVRHQR